jgi:hypothetical protein
MRGAPGPASPRLPASLPQAADRLEGSEVARKGRMRWSTRWCRLPVRSGRPTVYRSANGNGPGASSDADVARGAAQASGPAPASMCRASTVRGPHPRWRRAGFRSSRRVSSRRGPCPRRPRQCVVAQLVALLGGGVDLGHRCLLAGQGRCGARIAAIADTSEGGLVRPGLHATARWCWCARQRQIGTRSSAGIGPDQVAVAALAFST